MASDERSSRQILAGEFLKAKLEEYFWEWLSLPESQKLVEQTVAFAKDSHLKPLESFPSPVFHENRSPKGPGRPSPPGSPLSRTFPRDGSFSSDLDSLSTPSASAPSSPLQGPSRTPSEASVASGVAPELKHRNESDLHAVGTTMLASGSKTIPRFYWPRQQKPSDQLSSDAMQKIHEQFVKQGITEIKTYAHLEPIVSTVFGLSKYFAAPLLHKLKVFYDIDDNLRKTKKALLAPSPTPITEQMLIAWCNGRVQIDDPVISFFWVVKKDHNSWIEREDFGIFLTAILLTHEGLEFLKETSEFQERYADTVISRIFFVYDRKDVGRIYLRDLRRYKPSIVDTWRLLAEHDDIKMVRDYFSYEHFYVMYCTFWELDSDHDFLLDKDDLLKYDGHALSRRAIERIFSEIPTKFTSAVPGKMGYEDFIHFLLCDQDLQTDRSVEYWFHLFDLDGDGCIRDHELKFFYEEQVQRMECLNYDTISFADIMCQMNDMLFPKVEGQFRLTDFKRKKKLAGTFFSLFSSLNKFLAFEHRDPFLIKQEQLDNPNFSDWDRFCANEYLRLAMEEGEEAEEDNNRANDGSTDELAVGERSRKAGDGGSGIGL